MKVTRRSFLASAAVAPAVVRRRMPNVVFIMTDDHGAWATPMGGCAEMHMPHVGALAKGGTTFTRAFACTPVCSPSRMTWMTGQIPSRHGVQDWLRPVDSHGPESRRWLEGQRTWTEALAEAGYVLGLAGKWHMGHDDRPHAGFKWWATVPGGGGPYQDPVFYKNGEMVAKKGFKTDLVGDMAVEFLETRRGAREPFGLFLSMYAPHTPFDYQPEKYRAPYGGDGFGCFPRMGVNPRQNPGLARHHGNTASMRAYSALVTGADAQVGRVMEKLREMGALEDTVVVFTADQGWSAGHHGVWGKGNGTWPFNLYDGGSQVPLVWWHGGRIAAGRRERAMVSSYDFRATLLEYVGLKDGEKTAGQSYAGLLKGQGGRWKRDALFFEYAGVRGMRTERWKYLARDTGEEEMYDLEADAQEQRNVAATAAGRGAMARRMEEWFREQGAPPLKEWRGTTRQRLPEYQQP